MGSKPFLHCILLLLLLLFITTSQDSAVRVMAENVPLQGKIFCCTLSFVGSSVFECEQTVRNLSYHGNTRKSKKSRF